MRVADKKVIFSVEDTGHSGGEDALTIEQKKYKDSIEDGYQIEGDSSEIIISTYPHLLVPPNLIHPRWPDLDDNGFSNPCGDDRVNSSDASEILTIMNTLSRNCSGHEVALITVDNDGYKIIKQCDLDDEKSLKWLEDYYKEGTQIPKDGCTITITKKYNRQQTWRADANWQPADALFPINYYDADLVLTFAAEYGSGRKSLKQQESEWKNFLDSVKSGEIIIEKRTNPFFNFLPYITNAGKSAASYALSATDYYFFEKAIEDAFSGVPFESSHLAATIGNNYNENWWRNVYKNIDVIDRRGEDMIEDLKFFIDIRSQIEEYTNISKTIEEEEKIWHKYILDRYGNNVVAPSSLPEVWITKQADLQWLIPPNNIFGEEGKDRTVIAHYWRTAKAGLPEAISKDGENYYITQERVIVNAKNAGENLKMQEEDSRVLGPVVNATRYRFLLNNSKLILNENEQKKNRKTTNCFKDEAVTNDEKVTIVAKVKNQNGIEITSERTISVIDPLPRVDYIKIIRCKYEDGRFIADDTISNNVVEIKTQDNKNGSDSDLDFTIDSASEKIIYGGEENKVVDLTEKIELSWGYDTAVNEICLRILIYFKGEPEKEYAFWRNNNSPIFPSYYWSTETDAASTLNITASASISSTEGENCAAGLITLKKPSQVTEQTKELAIFGFRNIEIPFQFYGQGRV